MLVKAYITFNNDFILAQREKGVAAVSYLIEYLKEEYNIKLIDSSINGCTFVVLNEFYKIERGERNLKDFITEIFDIDKLDDVAKYRFVDYMNEEVDTERTAAEEIELKRKKAARLEKVMAKIDGLIGAEQFKELAHELYTVAPSLVKHNTVHALLRNSYLFSINDGNGLTTYLELFCELLEALEVERFGPSSRFKEIKVYAPQGKETASRCFSDVYNIFNYHSATSPKIICIDISEWMTKVTEPEFREILFKLEDNADKFIYIFRVPFLENEVIKGLKRGLGDVLSVRDISFVPFDNEELRKYADKSLLDSGFTMAEDAWEIFNCRVEEEKNDGKFYGINTVNKIVREIIYAKLFSDATCNIDSTFIKKGDITSISTTYNEQQISGLEMLNGMIGMETISKRVEEIVAQIEMSLKNKNLGSPCIHMRFLGNPGTGKTTVARVIGKILKEKGILRNGSFLEHSGRDFCGRFIGETAPKTSAICRDAYGSVLFIDEAYSLYRASHKNSNDFGREAIDTLIAEMENHRSDLVVIMAGYTEEMEELMKANAGLESRMPYIIEFPNYTREQLYQIYMLMVNKNFTYGEGFAEAVREYFDTLPDEIINTKEFSNARFVRNLFERTWGKAVLRAQLNKTDVSVLTKEDFLLASSEKEFKKIMRKPNRTLGFI